MWLFTEFGFFSATVADQREPERLKVRSRFRGDLEALIECFDLDCEVVEGAGTDYPYRVFLSRSKWGEIVGTLAAGIDYPNFKGQVARRQGYDRSHLYGKIWRALYGAEKELKQKAKRRQSPSLPLGKAG